MAVNLLFDDVVERAVFLVHHLQKSLNICEDVIHRKNGLRTRQFGVLKAIKSMKDPVTPTDVAIWLNRETNSITLMIDRMEKQGLVSRIRDMNDRRSLRLSLTKKGEQKYKQGNRSQKALSNEVMSCLSEKELREIVVLMEKMLEKTFEIRNLEGKVKQIRVKK